MHKNSWLYLPLCLALCSNAQLLSAAYQGNSVIVPALVEGKSGEIAYDLAAADFSVKDDGVDQQIKLRDDPGAQPLSLLIVIQTGHQAAPRLAAITQLDDLLDSIFTSPNDQAAVLTFDTRPHLLQGLTAGSDTISHALASITPGDGGAALFDALHLAMTLLDKAPTGNRRAVLLISGEHDHGSYLSGTASLIQDVSSRNVTIYSLTFTPPRKTLLGTLRLANPLAATASEMQRNAANALAQLTGGDFYRFDTEKNFEAHVVQVANHIHNAYCLTFQPRDPHPGFHSLQVSVNRSKTDIVSARSGYWVLAANGSTDGRKPQ
jgi:VWFA-related protein